MSVRHGLCGRCCNRHTVHQCFSQAPSVYGYIRAATQKGSCGSQLTSQNKRILMLTSPQRHSCCFQVEALLLFMYPVYSLVHICTYLYNISRVGANLDAQNEAPSGIFGLKKVEEGSPRAANVQRSGWRGGEPHPDILTRCFKNRSHVLDDVFHQRTHAWYAALLGA